MNDIFNNIEKFVKNNSIFIMMGFVLIYMIIVILFLRNRRMKEKISLDLDGEVNFGQENIQKEYGMLNFEKVLYAFFKIDKNIYLITAVRLLVVISAFSLIKFLGPIGILIGVEVFLILKTYIDDKQIEIDIGIARNDLLNNFLNFYISSIDNGVAVKETMTKYVALYGDAELTLYLEDKNRPVPQKWLEIIRIYENSLYSESNGLADKTHLYQKEIESKATYFKKYLDKIGEVTPICYCYYIGVPAIGLMSYAQFNEFWHSFAGYICIIVILILLVVFNRMVQKFKQKSCRKIFSGGK